MKKKLAFRIYREMNGTLGRVATSPGHPVKRRMRRGRHNSTKMVGAIHPLVGSATIFRHDFVIIGRSHV